MGEAPMMDGIKQKWTDEWARGTRSKWHAQAAAMTRAVTEAIVRVAHPKPGMHVLDLASGTGEPALTLAAAVGRNGSVIATDLSPGALAAAVENARQQGLANMSFVPADAEALPFAERMFDVVTCRFGAMFFPNHAQAFQETRRVLKPGGRAAFVAWGPFEQPYFLSTVGVFLKYVSLPAPQAGITGPFKFAERSTLSAALREAGFREVQEELCAVQLSWPGPVEQAWQFVREVAASFRHIYESLPPELEERVVGEVYAAMRQYSDGQRVNFPAQIVVASGTR